MAIRKSFTNRLLFRFKTSPPVTLEHSPYLQSSIVPLTSPDTGSFLNFIHRRGVNNSASTRLPDFISVPLRDKLREKLRSTKCLGDHARTDNSLYRLTVDDARKLLRLSQCEELKVKLRQIPRTSISYAEFLRICVESCGREDQGADIAKRLDESGEVINLGNVVFLRPEQVTKTMETIISQSMRNPRDSVREELEQMEKQKADIDKKAQAQVRCELYCGLGFLLAQTAGFMRLTFWELSWDVMEPICFFVTSIHFALAYVFFVRTSTEPTFEGYFHRRFKTKQKRLMKAEDFDLQKYNELKRQFHPEQYCNKSSAKFAPFTSLVNAPDCTCRMCMLHHS